MPPGYRAVRGRGLQPVAPTIRTIKPVTPATATPAQYTPPHVQPQPAQQPQAPAQFIPDAQYLAEQAQRAFERQQQFDAIQSQGRNDETDTAESIRRLLSKVQDDRTQITAGANRQGLLYSGTHAKRLGDYETDVAQRQGDLTLGKQRRDQERAAVRAALEQGAPLEEAAARAAAIGREIEQDTLAAQNNMLVANPDPAPTSPVAVIAAARANRKRITSGLRARSRRTGIRL